MLYRKRQKDIENWLLNKEKCALLLTGVRQAGKTFLIKKTLEDNNANYVEFNFVNQPDLLETLKKNKTADAKKILALLSAYTNKPLIKNETIIFFDEVQMYKEIVTMIKYLVDEGSYRYVMSGSLLGVELNDLRSAPVGYLREINLFPLDFEEFLYATTGIRDELIDDLKNNFENLVPINEGLHQKMLEHFYNYLVIGGMPKAVQNFVDNNDYLKVELVHKEIFPEYKRDFSQYEEKNKKLKLIDAYDLIPAELNSKNKRFVNTDLDKNLKYKGNIDTYDWLIHAGVGIPTYNVVEPRLPLLLNKQHNLFKLFLSDVGLLTSIYGHATRISLLNKDGVINYGAIFENVVAQELNSHNYKCYYFNSKKQGEVDFVIERNNKCLPIEVKSGKDYKIHSALNNILKNKDYAIEKAFVLSNSNIEVKDQIIYLPIYMIMFI